MIRLEVNGPCDGAKGLKANRKMTKRADIVFTNQIHKHICYVVVVVLRFNDSSTFMGNFASHPREKEKMDKRKVDKKEE